MTNEYYGPSQFARSEINKLLGFVATGKEQDWEFEFAAPSRIQEMLDILENAILGDESRDALALLLIASLEELDSLSELEEQRAIKWFERNKIVRRKMFFYWIQLRRASNPEQVLKLLADDS
ncbi:hypothetical protein WKW79_35925 [Variovorax robiniae]|uniref:Uncharacterized protein n=1 Tax=Variovorax robiniae TaxID=1836199 RepID=A0ABU8XJC9_9BURK